MSAALVGGSDANRRRFVTAGVALCAAFLGPTGCALQSRQLLTKPPTGVRRRVELVDTPFFPDDDYYCGPATLATLLSAGGLPTRPDELIGDVFLPARKGSLQLEMLAGARRRGAVATVIPGTLDAVIRETSAGHAVGVLQNLGLSWAPSWHYAVVVGYDIDARHLLLRSGPIERQTLALRTFEHTWARGGHWAFVVLPPGQLPASAGEDEVTRALVAFERSAEADAAIRGYAAALERWPDSLTLAIGLGNAQYAVGDLDAAEAVFRRVAQQHETAPAYNNLAIVLLERGRCDAARDAALRALSLGGTHDAAVRETLSKIDSRLSGGECRC